MAVHPVTPCDAAVGHREVRVDTDVNGAPVSAAVPAQRLLIDFLRDDLELTGVKRGCDAEVCGACTVLVGGLPVSSCCYLAAGVDGQSVETCEGLGSTAAGVRLQQAFLDHGALQCGYCTPGMLMSALSLFRVKPDASADEIRQYMSGNLCRCTGYTKILDAITDAFDAAEEA